jgi:hypothetical protein
MPEIGIACAAAVVIGELVEIDAGGVAWIDWPDHAGGPVRARTLVQIDSASPQPILIAFVGSAAEPIVLGLLHDRLVREAPPPGSAAVTVSDDGRTVSIEAAERLELRCGDTTLVMTAAGDLVLRGERIVSRASETNKIRGAAVLIN